MGNVRILYSVILVVALLTLVPIASISADEITDTNAEGSFTTLPFAFIANEGQFVDGIAFQTTSPEQVISLRSDRIEYIHADGSAPVSVIFKGAEPNPVISGHDPMDGTAGFFYGSDPDTWTTGVELVTKVIYEGLYPGIDMQLSGSQGVLKTEFIVQPGADPSQIALQYEGQTEIYIDDEGALVASTGTRDIIDETPFSYQIVQDIETSVESAYLLSKDNVVTFELGSYDNTLPLVIDPVMRYSLYFGGGNKDLGNAIAVDDYGYAYMLGTAMSRSLKYKPEFSILSAQGNNAIDNSRDAFLVKINPDGTALEYLIYIGGSSEDEGNDLYLDTNGDIYICGATASRDFPTVNAFRNSLSGGRDAYITKINAAGTDFIFSTYIGGSANDEALGITLDQDRNILITGLTRSWDFPIVNRYELSPFGGMVDAFITKMNPTASAIIYSNFIGGSAYDVGRAIAVDAEGYAVVVGETESRDFPLVRPFQAERKGHWNAFVVAFDPEGTYPAAYSTYLGGSKDDYARDILAWPNGYVTVVGKTNSKDFPTENAIQPYLSGLWDGFITTFSPEGNSLVQSTYFGGSANEEINGIARDGEDNVYVIGTTNSKDLAIVNAYQSRLGGASDAFITKFDSAVGMIKYSTYLGGHGNDEGRAIAVTTEGDAYVTGYTESKNFPQVWPFQQHFGDGDEDAFVAVISDNAYIPLPEFVGVPTEGEAPLTVQFTDLSRGIPTAWHWNFGDGEVSAERDPQHVYSTPGIYTVSLTVSNIVSEQSLTKEDYIVVREPVIPPIADFAGVPQSGIIPLTVSFTDLTLNEPTSWYWDFGDGASSTEQNPIYTYIEPGIYTVSLTATNSAGSDTAIKFEFVTAVPPAITPIADFTGVPQSGAVPLSVVFTDLSLNEPTSWSWEFGDGGVSTEQHPTYTYTEPGIYTVSLTATNSAGSDTAIKTEFVMASPAVIAPIADFSANPRFGDAPLTVKFADLSLNQPTSWSWEFGDGGVSTEQHPTYTYMEAGTYTVSLTVQNEAGIDTATKTEFVTASPAVIKPIADFIGIPQSGVAPLTVLFTDLSLNQPTSWSWEFGDGGVSTEQHPSYTYIAPGTYTVSLTVTNSAGTDTAIQKEFVFVSPAVLAPIADFSANPRSGVAPLTVKFADLSQNQPTSWSWKFGDGGVSAEQHPSYTYTAPGTYTVTLTVTNSAGTDTAIQKEFVFVSPAVLAPIADFSANPRLGVAPLTVKFADLSLNQPTSWSWEFGDGGVSTEQHPSYTYTAPGTYMVSLTVTNSAGIDTAMKPEFVTVSPSVIKPIADFKGVPQSGVAPLTVLFTDLSLNEPTSWLWNFGDDSTSTEQNPSYTYTAPGTYTVTLTVTNSAGTDTAIRKEFVFVSPSVIKPIADFSANPRFGDAPLTVKFADLSHNQPTSWSWDFGDGGVSTEQHPTYLYTTPGTYTVTLTVQNEAGIDTASKAQFITASNPVPEPKAAFNAHPKSGDAPLTVTFTDRSTGQPDRWLWEFGDGQSSTEQSPVYTYQSLGTYQVLLTIENSRGSSKATDTITVTKALEKPIASFVGVPTSGRAPLTVMFTDTSTGGVPDAWQWDFGDGGMSSLQNPSYTYTKDGAYTVRLTVSNAAGSSEAIKEFYISVSPAGHAPVAQFRAAPTTGTAPLHVAFTDLSMNVPTSWYWTFGDGTTSAERHPEHVYTAPGTYTITLTASNEFGESFAQRENYITVYPNLPDLKASFMGEPTSGMAPLTVTFTDLSVGEPKTWLWNFGDGDTSTERNPVHVYRDPGTYTVYLTVTRDEAQDVIAKYNYITVSKKPEIEVDFSAYPTSGDVPLCVQFTDLSTGDITTWLWDFGDGTTSMDRNPSHTYLEVGEYMVCLTASNAYESKEKCMPNFVRVTGSKLPAEFYGTLTIGDELAPVGTLVLARGPGVQTEVEGNPVTLTTPGCFGTIFPLTVYGSIQNGDPVTFWVKTPDMADYVEAEVWDVYSGNQWQKSYPFYGGTRTRIDLRVGGDPIAPMPLLPHEFYGEVMYNGQPLPQGSMVLVKGQNVLEGRPGNPLPVTSAGFYGVSGETKLVAQGDLVAGDELTFWVVLPGTSFPISAQCRDVDANSGWYDSYKYKEGSLTRLDLKAGTDNPPVPIVPMTMSGRVIVDEKPGVVGSLVSATGAGVQTGISGNPVTVLTSALYGTPEKLKVQGDIAEGTPIFFTVFDSTTGLVYEAKCRVSLCPLDVDAQCAEYDGEWLDSYPFHAGDDVVLDLKAYSYIPMSVAEAE